MLLKKFKWFDENTDDVTNVQSYDPITKPMKSTKEHHLNVYNTWLNDNEEAKDPNADCNCTFQDPTLKNLHEHKASDKKEKKMTKIEMSDLIRSKK